MSLCSATKTDFDPMLSKVKILREARAVILKLEKQEQEAQRLLYQERVKHHMLCKQKAVLEENLSKSMSPQEVMAISENAVKECRERRAQALVVQNKESIQEVKCKPKHELLHLQNVALPDEEDSNIIPRAHIEEPPAKNSDRLPSLHSTKLIPDQQNMDSTRAVTSEDDSVCVLSEENSTALSGVSNDTSMCMTRPLPEDTVDLISSTSGDQDSMDADQGSPSPARYEDISDPEDMSEVEAKSTLVPPSEAATVMAADVALPLVQHSNLNYEDISDVEEARPPNYEDISDPEEVAAGDGENHSNGDKGDYDDDDGDGDGNEGSDNDEGDVDDGESGVDSGSDDDDDDDFESGGDDDADEDDNGGNDDEGSYKDNGDVDDVNENDYHDGDDVYDDESDNSEAFLGGGRRSKKEKEEEGGGGGGGRSRRRRKRRRRRRRKKRKEEEGGGRRKRKKEEEEEEDMY
ncbi:replicase polyprotein 1a [Plakobranchus ocellatus]|uniref:Replicase polyprotein 1a n=1 Tax=Plakobranchus ocellatus TaxID=259542 RepID=A0AAV4DN69_9GAST|nr:replicase polyprotein 1a [Plakobranchus ocellatus]